MIKKLNLENYRCYDKHEINFRSQTIIVGKNNAGKSILIEALRLISIVVSRFRGLKFSPPPTWLEKPLTFKGVSPSLKGVNISKDNLYHMYGDPPCVIIATFKNNYKVELYIGPDAQLHAVLFDQQSRIIQNKSQANSAKFLEINILPQIGPLLLEEETIGSDYVLSNLSSSLASRHFRNQLNVLYSSFKSFKEMAEETWPNLRIRELNGRSKTSGSRLSLMVQDNAFVAEVGWMGHGLQMWLQTMWFLARCPKRSTIILDEPDVYMHADLQRKLIRFIRNRFEQVLIATHSVEIMAEVEPEEVLIIDRSKPKSNFTSNLPAVQSLIDNIGSIQNIELARLWSAKKFLIVEGKDVSILKRFQNTLYPNSEEPLDQIPNMQCGGWAGWNYVIGSKMLLKNAGDTRIKVYSVFDSDYHTEEDKQKRLSEAESHDIYLHIWKKKEIENYLLNPESIYRLIRKSRKTSVDVTVEIVRNQVIQIIDSMRDEVIDNFSTEIGHRNRGHAVGTVHAKARTEINAKWDEYKFDLVSGKSALKLINQWIGSVWKTSISTVAIAREIKADEIPNEIKQFLKAVETRSSLKHKDFLFFRNIHQSFFPR